MADFDDALDALAEENDGKAPARICTVGYVLSQVTDEQSKKLAALLDNNVVPASKIAAVLKKNGYKVNEKSISRHRRRKRDGWGCTCP